MLIPYSRLVTVALALAVAALGWQSCQRADAEARAARMSVQATRSHMQANGWGTVTVTRYVAGVAPELEERAKAAEAAGATIAAGTRVEGSATFEVPREVACPPAAEGPIATRVDVDAQGIIAADPGGGWWYDAVVFADLTIGDWTDRRRAVLKRADVQLSKPLAEAWTFSQAGGYRNELRLGAWTDGYGSAGYTRWFTRHVGGWGEYRHPLDPQDARALGAGVALRF